MHLSSIFCDFDFHGGLWREFYCGEVFPSRIFELDQANFLFATVTFDLFFSRDSGANFGKPFKVNKAEDAVVGGEAGDASFAMLRGSAMEFVGDAGVEGAGAASDDVHVIGAVHLSATESN